jgi:hypothetical protein
MKNKNTIKLWSSVITGLAIGWIMMYLIVKNWDKIKSLAM